MIILLPSYRRTALLPHVLKSILNAESDGIQERISVLIHNNYPKAKKEISQIISQLPLQARLDVFAVHRERTVDPVEGWFDALLSVAKEGETVILLGDDDLLTPWGMLNRYEVINNAKGDLLISNHASRVYFFENGSRLWADLGNFKCPSERKQATKWELSVQNHMRATFISNHCYRNTRAFRSGVELAFSLSRKQKWAPSIYTTALIPAYLPYTIEASGGTVLSLDEHSVLRGSIYEEAIRQDYSDGGTTSFFSLLALNTFSNTDLHSNQLQFDLLRSSLLKSLRSGILENIGNRNIRLSMFRAGMRATNLRWLDLLGRDILNKKLITRIIPQMRGWTLRRKNRNGNTLVQTSDFLSRLSELYDQTRQEQKKGSSEEKVL